MSRDMKIGLAAAVVFLGAVAGAVVYKARMDATWKLPELTELVGVRPSASEPVADTVPSERSPMIVRGSDDPPPPVEPLAVAAVTGAAPDQPAEAPSPVPPSTRTAAAAVAPPSSVPPPPAAAKVDEKVKPASAKVDDLGPAPLLPPDPPEIAEDALSDGKRRRSPPDSNPPPVAASQKSPPPAAHPHRPSPNEGASIAPAPPAAAASANTSGKDRPSTPLALPPPTVVKSGSSASRPARATDPPAGPGGDSIKVTTPKLRQSPPPSVVRTEEELSSDPAAIAAPSRKDITSSSRPTNPATRARPVIPAPGPAASTRGPERNADAASLRPATSGSWEDFRANSGPPVARTGPSSASSNDGSFPAASASAPTRSTEPDVIGSSRPAPRADSDPLAERGPGDKEVIARAVPVSPAEATSARPRPAAGAADAGLKPIAVSGGNAPAPPVASAESGAIALGPRAVVESYRPVGKREGPREAFLPVGPAAAAPARAPVPDAERPTVVSYDVQSYVVLEGDTFHSIAEAMYKDGSLGERLAKYNRTPGGAEPLPVGRRVLLPPIDVLAGGSGPAQVAANSRPSFWPKQAPTTDPSAAPRAAAAAVANANPPGMYTTLKAEPLYAIAKKTLGDGRRWREIYELNSDRLSDPFQAPAGIALRLPPAER